MSCWICLSEGGDAIRMSCSCGTVGDNVYHIGCLLKWQLLTGAEQCPICKASLPDWRETLSVYFHVHCGVYVTPRQGPVECACSVKAVNVVFGTESCAELSTHNTPVQSTTCIVVGGNMRAACGHDGLQCLIRSVSHRYRRLHNSTRSSSSRGPRQCPRLDVMGFGVVNPVASTMTSEGHLMWLDETNSKHRSIEDIYNKAVYISALQQTRMQMFVQAPCIVAERRSSRNQRFGWWLRRFLCLSPDT